MELTDLVTGHQQHITSQDLLEVNSQDRTGLTSDSSGNLLLWLAISSYCVKRRGCEDVRQAARWIGVALVAVVKVVTYGETFSFPARLSQFPLLSST